MREYAKSLCVILAVASVLSAHGCGKRESLSEPRQSEASSDQEQTKNPTPKQRALAAKGALFKRLSSELMAAMSERGPAAAIQVCSQRAPKLAAAVGREHGVSIGRTSFKLRNPANATPAWAVRLVEQRVKAPQFVELDDQITGALLPIHLKSQCLACHGDEDQMAEDVRLTLADLYPEDRATGFQDGDLRGWFWVEVPVAAVDK